MPNMTELWSNTSWQEDNLSVFRLFMKRNPQIDFTHPNYDKSPWHVQGTTRDGEVIDFWPHKMKGCYRGCVRTEISGLEWLVAQAEMLEGFDVFE